MPQKSSPIKSNKTNSKTRRITSKKFLGIISSLLIVGLLTIIIWFVFFRTTKPKFDGEQAFQYLVQQCEFGPRNPGSSGHAECKAFLTSELKKYCDRVEQQDFEYQDKKDPMNIYHGTNIIASINLHPKERKRIMLCAHWDTRPWADQDPIPENHSQPIIGANDGASGVAVLLEIAWILKSHKPDISVDIILFDLEDIGDYKAEQYPDSLNPFSMGSEYFVSNNNGYNPAYGILLDLIGDQDLQIKKEAFSVTNAEPIVNKVWNAANKVGAKAFSETSGEAIYDDHIPFLKKGISVIDLIDFDYPYWHTAGDTPDKCSTKSLQEVGDVLVEVIFSEF